MPRRIGVVTTGRADFGHLRPILREITRRRGLELVLFVTGTHLDRDFGQTGDEIEKAGFRADVTVPLMVADDTPAASAAALGRCVVDFADVFRTNRPDILLVTGDRFEMFAIAIAAVVSGLAVAHLSGGDLTEGALDDGFRHSMSKLSHLHFPTTQASAKRLQQMGEESWRIHVVGEPSLDLLREIQWPEDRELAAAIGIEPSEWESPLLVTVHPVTLHPEGIGRQISNLIEVLKRYRGLIVITAANRDPGGMQINEQLRALAAERPGTIFMNSLGWETYAAFMRRARAMLGNSSSGLVEAASFGLPVVDVGDRQKGRLRPDNVIHAEDEPEAIAHALERAISLPFRLSLQGLKNPYGTGCSASAIADVLESVSLSEGLRIKRFVEAGI